MAKKIKVWQIKNESLIPLETTLSQAGRKEFQDFEKWIKSYPEILGEDIVIIGEQVQTKSGPLDFFGIDRTGNIVIIELKRDFLPREVLTQSIDYASDIASWDIDKLSDECKKYSNKSLEELMSDKFQDINLDEININQAQRILLIGTNIEESLERMIEWLSSKYEMNINIIILKYIKTESGEELIVKTTTISEEIEKERRRHQLDILSDEEGNYNDEDLRKYLINYLSENRDTPRRIRKILLPLCLRQNVVKRDDIRNELLKTKEADDEEQARVILPTISRELGIKYRDYLRQIITYERDVERRWEKNNFQIKERYKELVKNILNELGL